MAEQCHYNSDRIFFRQVQNTTMDSCEHGVDDFLTLFMDAENSILGIPLNLENDVAMMDSDHAYPPTASLSTVKEWAMPPTSTNPRLWLVPV